mgnify:CR=1 FL=1|jgi:hypothetical protein|tara:strand:+ start:13 stop:429 length:417 start_codon:yes stop_codon:yes gene_type:complete
MAKKLKTITKLKKELDAIFSTYVRLRDASIDGIAICVTCNASNHYKKLQNGHFMSRRHMATRFEEKNTAVQCMGCNMYNQGMQYEMSKYLDKKYGEGTAEEMQLLAHTTVKIGRADYEYYLDLYKEKVKQIKLNNNIN